MYKNAIWCNQKMLNEATQEFVKKYPNCNFDTCKRIAEEGSFTDFRLLCSVLSDLHYDNVCNIDPRQIPELETICDTIVYQSFGEELTSLYKFFLKSQNVKSSSEYLMDIHPYKLFSADFADSGSRSALVAAIIFMVAYKNKTIAITDLAILERLINSSSLYKIYPKIDDYRYGYEEDENMYKKINDSKKKHLDAWMLLAECLWYKKYDSAYHIICKYLNK